MAEKKVEQEENVKETPQVTNLDTTSVEVIEAEMVRMHQSAAQEITADEVGLHQSAALDVAAAEVSTHESALGLVSAKDVEMTNSAAGAIRAENVNLTGSAGVVIAESVNLGNTYAGVVAGSEVRGEQIETLFLFSNHVEGDVQTVVDTRGALIAGMVGGLLTGTILLIGRLVFGRRS
jgi:redox-regulated HSP33 family molecular chaperone